MTTNAAEVTASTERRNEAHSVSERQALASAGIALALMAIQAAVIRMSPSDAPLRVALPLTIALAPFALWPHRARLGVWVIFVGLVANLTVIVANGGLMPIEQQTVVEAVGAERAVSYGSGSWIEGSKDILVAPGKGKLVALGDSIIIRAGGRGIAASPGDLVVWAGILIAAGEMSFAWQRRERAAKQDEAIRPRAEGSATTAR